MNPSRPRPVVSSGLAALLLLAASVTAQEAAQPVASPRVTVLHVPGHGVQPQAAVDAAGTLHVVYFAADQASRDRPVFRRRGDLFLVTRAAGADGWSEPVQVNSEAGSVGRVSFPQIALGVGGRVHVGWATMEPPGEWYARSADRDGDGNASLTFEPQRNLIAKDTRGIENGPALVTDRAGKVWLAWHEGAFADEQKRGVAVVTSTDDGATFSRPRRVSPADAGACACCGLGAVLDPAGVLHVAFRGAAGKQRDMLLLSSSDGGKTFASRALDGWEIQRCPTALTAFAATPQRDAPVVAWETEGQVRFTRLADAEMTPIAMPSGPGKAQKHPSIALQADGSVLVAWAEVGPKLRQLAWCVFDVDGTPTAMADGLEALAQVSSAAAVALPDGGFVVVY